MMESHENVNIKVLTLTALLAFGFTQEDLKASAPAEKVANSSLSVSDYAPVNEVVSTHPEKEIEKYNTPVEVYDKTDYDTATAAGEKRAEIRHTQKTASIEKNGHTYTIEINYINGKPTQYRFVDKDSLKTITTVDGGQDILIGDSIYHDTKIDTLSNGTTQARDLVLGRAAHMDVTHPDGRPDIMTITAKNGAQIVLKCKYGKDGSSSADWDLVMEGKVKPADEDAKNALIKRAQDNHKIVPFQFLKEGGKTFIVSPDRASR